MNEYETRYYKCKECTSKKSGDHHCEIKIALPSNKTSFLYTPNGCPDNKDREPKWEEFTPEAIW